MNEGTKLYIIGNGFDIAHHLPVKYNPDFKKIAERYTYPYFWECYQTKVADIWSDFENLLAIPDFNSLDQVLDNIHPDSLNDDNDHIEEITRGDINVDLSIPLNIFAVNAEKAISHASHYSFFERLFKDNQYFISFNYTHTLEYLYGIAPGKVLHIHGEVGKNNLMLGYPEGDFSPEPYFEDVRMKGDGPYRKVDVNEFINSREDLWTRSKYQSMLDICRSFYKNINIDDLERFIFSIPNDIQEIIIYGHSCAIDFSYFRWLDFHFPNVKWYFYIKGDENCKQAYDVAKLIDMLGIKCFENIFI